MTAFQRFLVRFSTWGFSALLFAWLVVATVINSFQPKISWIPSLLLVLLLSVLVMAWAQWMRERFVREGPLPQFLNRKLRDAYPGLSSKDCDLAERGLRQFFLACVRSRRKTVAMPSKLLAHLWADFAGQAQAYENWCQTAFGRVLAPTPAQRLGRNAEENDALRRAWYWACKEEAINPKTPTRLPILFALDAKLAVAGGIFYAANSLNAKRAATGDRPGEVSFGASFSDGNYSGDYEGFGGADGGSGDGGGSDGGGGD